TPLAAARDAAVPVSRLGPVDLLPATGRGCYGTRPQALRHGREGWTLRLSPRPRPPIRPTRPLPRVRRYSGRTALVPAGAGHPSPANRTIRPASCQPRLSGPARPALPPVDCLVCPARSTHVQLGNGRGIAPVSTRPTLNRSRRTLVAGYRHHSFDLH